MSRIILSLVALLAPLNMYAQQASPSSSKMAVYLEGTVLKADGSPLTTGSLHQWNLTPTHTRKLMRMVTLE